MNGIQLKFFMHEHSKHSGRLLYEWLLEKAVELKLQGGSAYRALAGFGRHGHMHEEHFFEIASNVPVEVVFIVTEEECESLLNTIKDESLNIFYTKVPVEYGVLG